MDKEGIKMDSFISWIGGKKLLRKKILEAFPDEGTYSRYIEVFGGAGWVLFKSFPYFWNVVDSILYIFRADAK